MLTIQNINLIKLSGLAVLFFTLSLFFDRSFLFFDVEPDKGFTNAEVEKTVYSKTTEMDSLISIVSQMLKNEEFCELNTTIEYPECKSLFEVPMLKNIHQKGYAIFIFKDFDIKYWSDSSIPIKANFLDSCEQKQIMNVGNGYYLVRSQKYYNQIIVGLILIKLQYSFENEYLVPRFQSDFKIEPSVSISLTDTTENSIYSKDKQFLFSLTPMMFSRSDKPFYYPEIVFYSLFILLIVAIIILKLRRSYYGNISWLWFPALVIITLLLRFLMNLKSVPGDFYSMELFQPKIYAGSGLSPSLGDLLINAMLLIIFAYYLYIPVNVGGNELRVTYSERFFLFLPSSQKFTSILPEWKQLHTYIAAVLLLIVPFVFGVVTSSLNNMIFHSTLNFNLSNFYQLTVYTIVALFILGLIFAAFFLVIDKIIHFCFELVNQFQYIVISIFIFILYFAYLLVFVEKIDWWSEVFLGVVFVIVSHIRANKHSYGYYTYVLLISVAVFYTTAFLTITNIEKERGFLELKAINLAAERDGVAENLFKEIDEQISTDEILEDYIQDNVYENTPRASSIQPYLVKRHFSDPFWRRYNIQVRICGSSALFQPSNNLDNCIGYYSNLVDEKGTKLFNSNYFFINNMNGSISYLGFYEYLYKKDSTNVTLFLVLDSKLVSDMVGYPELLMDKDLREKASTIPAEYSYAKYLNNNLVAKKGSFPYSLVKENFSKTNTDLLYTTYEGYNHVIFNVDNKNTVILSKPQIKWIDILVMFSYLFLFFNLMLLMFRAYRFAVKIKRFDKFVYFGFKSKILLTMIVMLLLSFILVGSGTVYFDIQKYEAKHQANVSEKIESVIVELEQKYPEADMLSRDWQTGEYESLEMEVNKISRAFFTDINMYDLDGKLMTSSRPEAFSKGLMGQRMHPEAYRQLKLRKKAKFMHEEKLGETNYTSIYIPYKSQSGELVAYVNLPYFTKPGLLRAEISTLIVSVVNLYVLLLLITVVVAVFLADKITHPLRLLQSKFQEIELGRTNEQIFYESQDEIGALVKEYNSMVVELERNVELLAKSERESAWREMAKQIAHEIKNPLTPMKLSIQFLLKSWDMQKEKDLDKFYEKLQKVSKTLVDQIDNLSTIATEFSNFAKMPKPNNEMMDIIETVAEAVQLFANSEEAKVEIQPHNYTSVMVFADKERMSRVFINLLKNAIQSIPENKKGHVWAKIFANQRIVRVTIEDNGCGIPEELKPKLFSPSFTTKTSGMGMGLAIVKNIIESANGAIWFETEVNKGTRFFVELPRQNVEKE